MPSNPTPDRNKRAAPALKLVTAGVRSRPGGVSVTDRIVDSVTEAIVERRLMPGTHLPETQIAQMFSVSRTVVRQALNRLSRDRLITLERSRGAFVAMPSIDEARQVYEVRRLLESGMVRTLAAQITDAQIARLQAHLRDEHAAVQRADVPGRTRLLADFHVVLARLLGNEVLAQLIADLLSRSQLISLMYQSGHSAGHSCGEHVQIVEALSRRDGRAAARLMIQHISSVERNLRLDPQPPDLASILRPRV